VAFRIRWHLVEQDQPAELGGFVALGEARERLE